MSDFSLDFDLSEVAAPAEFAVLPAGKHRAIVHEVDIKPDFSGTGKTLWVKLTFLDGDLQNRKTVAFLDVHSETDWKQKKGRQQLVSLINAIGIEDYDNHSQLISDEPVGVVIGHYKSKAGETKDQVKAFIPASDCKPVDTSGEVFDSGDSPF